MHLSLSLLVACPLVFERKGRGEGGDKVTRGCTEAARGTGEGRWGWTRGEEHGTKDENEIVRGVTIKVCPVTTFSISEGENKEFEFSSF